MIKRYKGKLILASIVILLPVIAGLILWTKLPDELPVHWNIRGEIDGWGSKSLLVFGLPFFLLIIQWVGILATAADPKKQNHTEKILGLALWICPVLSLMLSIISYGTALGIAFKVDKIMLIMMGIMFIVIGNYMPKCKQNYTIGIKLPWTLNDEENWNRTHRISGKLWFVAGIVLAFCVLLPTNIMAVVVVGCFIVAILVPTVYSYCLHRKKTKDGE